MGFCYIPPALGGFSGGSRNRYHKPKRRSRENNHSCQPRCLTSSLRTAYPHHRLRSTRQYNQRAGLSKGSRSSHVVSVNHSRRANRTRHSRCPSGRPRINPIRQEPSRRLSRARLDGKSRVQAESGDSTDPCKIPLRVARLPSIPRPANDQRPGRKRLCSGPYSVRIFCPRRCLRTSGHPNASPTHHKSVASH
jgi:hypothetical protein